MPWLNRDFDGLMTFHDYVETIGSLAEVFEGTEVDDATQSALYEWFYDRKLNDVPDKFQRQFRRLLNAEYHRYIQYLRIDYTDFDPMVTQYLERWTGSQTKVDGNISREGETDLTGKTTNKTTGSNSGTSVTTSNDDSRGTTRSETTQNTTGKTTNVTNTDSLTKTEGETSSESTSESHGTSQSTTDGKNLEGALPNSSSYGTGQIPTSLNWTYTSGQGQSSSETLGGTDDTGQATATGTSTSTAEASGTSDTTGTSNQDLDSTTTGSSTNTSTGLTTTENEQTLGSDTAINTDNKTTTSDTTKTAASTLTDNKERLTGRGGAPQDLLNSARDYILRTNSFTWLVAKLDPVFMQMFEY